MGMSFQGPPPPLPSIWREPAFWVTQVALGGAFGAFLVGSDLVRLGALMAGSLVTLGFSHYRMDARQRAEEQLNAALWGKR